MAGFDNEVLFCLGERLLPSTSQEIFLMQQESTDVARINYTGDPNGNVSANPSSLCHDPVSGNVYFKQTGTGNTGWVTIQNAVLTANATPQFSNGVLDFSLNNLLLGSNGSTITTATNNVGFGQNSLTNLQDGSNCAAFGYQSLQNCNSYYNTAMGSQTLTALTTGSQNSAFGYLALNVCDSIGNCAFGNNALTALSGGGGNTTIGSHAAENLVSGQFNTIIGVSAGSALTGSESYNVYINNDGVNGESNHIRIGTPSLQNACSISGITGVTVAASAPVAINSVGQLSSLGFGISGRVLTSTGAASSPTWQVLPTSIATINGDSGSVTGSTVTIYSNNASNTSGASIKFVNSGTTSTLNTTDSNFNVFLGIGCGNTTVSGANNSAQGRLACGSLTSGDSNCALGSTSLFSNQSGDRNCAVGVVSLQNIVSGSGNVGIGHAAGQNYTSSESNNICIGGSVTGTVGESNTTRIGMNTTKCVIAGISGVTVANSSVVGVDSNGQLSSLSVGSSGQVLTSNSSGSPTWQYQGWNVSAATQGTTLTASTTYYSPNSGTPTTNVALVNTKFVLVRQGIIKKVYMQLANTGTLSSAELASFAISINGGSPTFVFNNQLDFSTSSSSLSTVGSLSLLVFPGDYLQFLIVTPAWTTAPTGAQISFGVLIEPN